MLAALWYGIALSGSTAAPEFRPGHHENHWFSKHGPKAGFAKHFFSMPEGGNTKKVSRTALAFGLLGAAAAGIGSIIFFTTVSYSFIWFFMLAGLLGLFATIISINLLRKKDLSKEDIHRARFALVFGILGLLVMIPALLLSVLEVD